jgi:hypothetical protein
MSSKLEQAIALCKRLLEVAENGDYSNGVGEFGADEGRMMTGDLLRELRKEVDELEQPSQ